MDRLSKLFIILAAAGIPDAAYHAYGEITAYSGPGSTECNITHYFSCITVFDSGYTKFPPGDGLSMWVYGIVWFPLMLFLGFLFASKRGGINGIVMLPILMVGNFFTLYCWYLELGVIHALCPVCISLYCLNYAMTAVAIVVALRQD
jgi:uncharacterized membrane protein